ncbi:MAG: NAD(P)/FAD-dependent oxidoreductase [Bacteroidia bacterium]|nr:NAD(P)/FAD-dependent oxidoreductase [Bacteroidia bacterium]
MNSLEKISIPDTNQKRVVIVGAGFGGLEVSQRLANSGYQVVLIDKNNYHQFQPLLYQVAMATVEPSSIIFPLRKIFRKKENVYVRIAEVEEVDPQTQQLKTSMGSLSYDYLVFAMGARSNFFGNKQIEELSIPMKSVSEALFLRNAMLEDFEKAIETRDYEVRQKLLDIVIVGGGATGVELAGSLAEMKKQIFPKDYYEIDTLEIDIYLIQGGDKLLAGMSEFASEATLDYLTQLGIKVRLNTRVTGYDGETVFLGDGTTIPSQKLIWAAGISGNPVKGLPAESIVRGNRMAVDEYNQVKNCEHIFAIGDIASMASEKYPDGHPQVAQVAIQQGKLLAKNLKRLHNGKPMLPFSYHDKGSMATIGRKKAVADLPWIKLKGNLASLIWMFIHLISLFGLRNKIAVFFNWMILYFTKDPYLRVNIKPTKRERAVVKE